MVGKYLILSEGGVAKRLLFADVDTSLSSTDNQDQKYVSIVLMGTDNHISSKIVPDLAMLGRLLYGA